MKKNMILAAGAVLTAAAVSVLAVISCTNRDTASVPTLSVDFDGTLHLDVSQMPGKTVRLERKKMYAVYEKSSGRTFSFDFDNGDDVLSQIVTYDESVYLFWESVSGQVGVTMLPIRELLNIK